MSRAQGRTSNSVSLFPFLAVLVCAMGALIFLLLITTRRIRHIAVEEALVAVETSSQSPIVLPVDVPVSEPASTSDVPPPRPSAVMAPVPQTMEPPPPDPNAKLKELIAALSQQRSDQQQRLDERQRRLAAIRSSLADADSRLEQLTRAVAAKQEQRLTAGVNRQVERAEYTRLGEEIDEAKIRLRQIEQQNATRSSKYAIIPYSGTSGTVRRPIFIECTQDGLTFLEEGITLTAADIDGFTVEFNPLLAGTRALLRHWNAERKDKPPDEQNGEPYVLLLVRPGGSIAYYAARRMLSELKQPSGYELLERDIELDVPAADPEAVAACRAAIDSVLRERKRLVDALLAAGNGTDALLRFRRGESGLEPVEPAQTISERAGQPGFGREGFGRDEGSSFGREAGEELLAGRPGSRGDSATEGNGGERGRFAGPQRRPGSPGDGIAGNGSRPSGRLLADRGTFAGNQRRPSAGGSGAGRNPGAFGHDHQNGGSFGEEGPPGARGLRPEMFDGSQSATNSGARGNASGRGTPGAALNHPAGRNNPAEGIADGTQFGAGGIPSTAGRPGSAGQPGAGAGPRTASEGSGSSGSGQFGGNPRNGGSPLDGSQSTAGGSSGSGGGQGAAGSDRRPPMPFRTFGQQAGSRGRAAERRSASRSWGARGVRNGIGFERATTISVTPDAIRVGRQPPIDIQQSGTTGQLVGRVLDALDRHARTWGPPPENFYWVPVVNFRVSPGGNQFYERLHGPLREVGIGSTVEYPLDSPVYRQRSE